MSKAQELADLLARHRDERVLVVGTSCAGTSTLARQIDGTVDAGDVVSPGLTPEEKAIVYADVWTPEVGRTVQHLVARHLAVEKGTPVFATVVFDADLLVHLRISDALLAERVALRRASLTNGLGMRRQLEEDIQLSGLPVIEFFLD